jgi:hypothetical protein
LLAQLIFATHHSSFHALGTSGETAAAWEKQPRNGVAALQNLPVFFRCMDKVPRHLGPLASQLLP